MLPQRVYAEINLDSIIFNVRSVMTKVNGTKVMAVIKTDGYGHGAVPIAKALNECGVYAFAVATVPEAVELRRNGIKNPILILGHVFEDSFEDIINYDIMHAVFEYKTAKELSDAAARLRKIATIHIKVDTGMGRIGFLPNSESIEEIKKISALPNIKIDGIFTHFACADMSDKASFEHQKNLFSEFTKKLGEAGVNIPIKHMCNSAAIIDYNGDYLDMVRSGIITYGIYPSDEVNKKDFPLKPAMSLISHIAYIKEVDSGFTVSYGSTYTTSRRTKIATIPVGYGDGYPRAMSNIGKVIINGEFADIIGRVCMDQFMVDVTDIPGVNEDDEVVIIGSVGDKTITVDEIAENSHRFNYELCCDINKRVPRVYIKDGKVSEIIDYLCK